MLILSVAKQRGINAVWVYQDGELQKRIVRLGRHLSDNRVVVSAGLHPGDKVSAIVDK